MNLFDIPAEIRKWVALGVTIAVLCLVFALLTMCQGRDVDRGRIRTEAATGKALDTVARETETIRTDEKEKADAVDAIPGSNDRLPDGYGARLECVRRGGERCNP